MSGRRVPDWTKALARVRPVDDISQFEDTIEESRTVEGMFPGLLRGMEDLRVFYDALHAGYFARERTKTRDSMTTRSNGLVTRNGRH